MCDLTFRRVCFAWIFDVGEAGYEEEGGRGEGGEIVGGEEVKRGTGVGTFGMGRM